MISSKERFAGSAATMARHGRDVNVSSCPAGVLAAGYGLKVVWAYTRPIAAKMVNFQSIRDRPFYIGIRPTVSKDVLRPRAFRSSRAKYSASVILPDRASPTPAGVGLFNLRPEAFSFGKYGQFLCSPVLIPQHIMVTTPSPATSNRALAALNTALKGFSLFFTSTHYSMITQAGISR